MKQKIHLDKSQWVIYEQFNLYSLAVSYIHNQKLVHGDLNPENIVYITK